MRLVRIARACLLAAAATAGIASAQEIRIGIPAPVTGPIAFLGQHMKWGAELAVDEINRKGGVLGRKVSFLMQDSGCRPADSVAAAERLISQDKVDLMIADLCSGATMALMPVVEKAGKPMLVSISTLPDITEKAGVGGNKWVFRTVPNDLMLARVIAKKMAAYRNVAFVAEDTDYGRGAVKLLKTMLPADLKIQSEDYVKNSETDFLPVLTRIRSAKPDAIATYVLDQQGMNFMKQYQQFGLTMPIVARPPLVSGLVVDLLATNKFNGSWTVYPYYDAWHSPENDAFTKPFVERNKQGPHYVAYGVYEAILIAADAIRRAGTAEPNAVRDALVKTSYKGILGTVKFDQNQQSHNNLMFLQVENGKLQMKELVAGQ